MSQKIEFTKNQIQDMYDLYYNKLKPISYLRKKYGYSQTVYERIFKENGWKFRPQDFKFSKYSVDETYFDVIDTPDKAYILGLLYADGCNHPETKLITLELQIDDYELLQQINNAFHNTRPIMITDCTKSKNRKKDTATIKLFSEHLSKRAIELNLVPRKSLILDFPYWMDKELIPYMLRGYIDGDGWIQKHRIGFMSTDKFCEGVKEYFDSMGLECHIRDLKRHYNAHTKTFDITNRNNIIPLTNMMFSDGNIFMKRKVDKYIQYGFLTK